MSETVIAFDILPNFHQHVIGVGAGLAYLV
jgi:hypothetical protein